MRLLLVRVPLVTALVVLSLTTGLRAQSLLGPTPYLSFADSPFNALSSGGGFSYFHLETFENGLFDSPGVSANNGVVVGPSSITDSVDGDDGVIDGSGNGGHSFFGFGSVTFTFNATTLGALPTHAGIVWTDGQNNPTFEAFDGFGVSLGTLTGTSSDGLINGGTAEDRFFGAYDPTGISAITITDASWEVDHLQYGLAVSVPEPATNAVLAGAAALALAAMARRRRRQLAP